MFEFEFDNANKKMKATKSVSEPAALTQEEVAEVIRIAESYSLSRTDLIKLLRLLRDRKQQAYSKPKHN